MPLQNPVYGFAVDSSPNRILELPIGEFGTSPSNSYDMSFLSVGYHFGTSGALLSVVCAGQGALDEGVPRGRRWDV